MQELTIEQIWVYSLLGIAVIVGICSAFRSKSLSDAFYGLVGGGFALFVALSLITAPFYYLFFRTGEAIAFVGSAVVNILKIGFVICAIIGFGVVVSRFKGES